MGTAQLLSRRSYFIREHIGFLKLKDTFDILDAETREHLGYATEENPAWLNWTRLLLQKHRMPTTVVVRNLTDDAPLLRLERGWRFLRSKIRVYDGQDELLGYFESKVLTLGGGFHVYNARGIRVVDLQALKALLNGGTYDGDQVGRLVHHLGTETSRVASFAEGNTRPHVEKLGAALLAAAGQLQGGNTSPEEDLKNNNKGTDGQA